jgi:hypothetical protein
MPSRAARARPLSARVMGYKGREKSLRPPAIGPRLGPDESKDGADSQRLSRPRIVDSDALARGLSGRPRAASESLVSLRTHPPEFLCALQKRDFGLSQAGRLFLCLRSS